MHSFYRILPVSIQTRGNCVWIYYSMQTFFNSVVYCLISMCYADVNMNKSEGLEWKNHWSALQLTPINSGK